MGRVISWELELVGSHGLAARSYGELFALVQRGAAARAVGGADDCARRSAGGARGDGRFRRGGDYGD